MLALNFNQYNILYLTDSNSWLIVMMHLLAGYSAKLYENYHDAFHFEVVL